MGTEGGGTTAWGGSRETVVRQAVVPSGFDVERAERWATRVRPKWHASWAAAPARPAPAVGTPTAIESQHDAPRQEELEKLAPSPVVHLTRAEPAEAPTGEAPQTLTVEQHGDALAAAATATEPAQPLAAQVFAAQASRAAPPVAPVSSAFEPTLDAPETPRFELPVNGQHPARFVAVGLLAAVAAAVGFFAVRGGDFAHSRSSEPTAPATAGSSSVAPPSRPRASEPLPPPPPELPAEPARAETATDTKPSQKATSAAPSPATPKPSVVATPAKGTPAPSSAKPNVVAAPRPSTPPVTRPTPELKPPPSALMPPVPHAPPASQSPQSPNIVRDSPF